MTSRRTLGLMTILALALVVSGCARFPSLSNPFNHPKPSKYSGSGERISVLGPGDVLTVSDALKGQDFFLPDAQPVAAAAGAGSAAARTGPITSRLRRSPPMGASM